MISLSPLQLQESSFNMDVVSVCKCLIKFINTQSFPFSIVYENWSGLSIQLYESIHKNDRKKNSNSLLIPHLKKCMLKTGVMIIMITMVVTNYAINRQIE